MDVPGLVRRLGISNNKVRDKAEEFVRVVQIRFAGRLGQAEICKNAVCLELACTALGEPADRSALMRFSGTTEKVYKSSLNMLQKVLQVKARVGIRELCMQFGCARLEQSTIRHLNLYKERFLKTLAPSERLAADFSRPVFITAAFWLTARKEKLKVDKTKLLQPLGISDAEFAGALTSMNELIFDVVGVEKQKRQAARIKSNRGILDRHAGDQNESDDDGDISEEEGLVHRPSRPSKKAKQQEYAAWKERVLQTSSAAVGTGAKKKPMTQATLCFGLQPSDS